MVCKRKKKYIYNSVFAKNVNVHICKHIWVMLISLVAYRDIWKHLAGKLRKKMKNRVNVVLCG